MATPRRPTVERHTLRRVLWGFVLALHVGYAAAYAVEARFYVDTLLSPSYFSLLLKTFGRTNDLRGDISNAVLVSSATISAWHAVAAGRMVRVSWTRRRLLFRDATRPTLRPPPVTRFQTAWHCLTAPWHAVTQLWSTYCGVDGVYFEFVADVREAVEIATQTYAVYRLSRFVAGAGINRLAALALVANCWSTPALGLVLHKSPRGPFVRTLVGTALASIFTIAVPVAVFLPYYQLALAPVATRYDPRDFINRGNLFQQIFTLTWKDWLSTRFAAALAISALETIKRKASERRRSSRRVGKTSSVVTAAAVAAATKNVAAIVPYEPSHDRAPSNGFDSLRVRSADALDSDSLVQVFLASERSHVVARLLFFGVGLAVLVLHLVASFHPDPLSQTTNGVDCTLVLRPWLKDASQCAVLTLNCHRLQIHGHQHEWDAVLPTATTLLKNLLAVRFSHCTAFDAPTQLQHMHSLIQIIVFNVTLASWSDAAALTTRTNPVLTSVVLLHVRNVRTLPPGLLAFDFPAIVFDASGTDLEDLPRDLAQRWPSVMEVIALEHGILSFVPVVLTEMQIGRLSLAVNRIRSVPVELFTNHNFNRAIQLTDNPLNELPTDNVTDFRARNVGLIGTNVSVLPEWITRAATRPPTQQPFVHADNSPLCRQPVDQRWRSIVECETSSEMVVRYSIPLDDITAANPP